MRRKVCSGLIILVLDVVDWVFELFAYSYCLGLKEVINSEMDMWNDLNSTC